MIETTLRKLDAILESTRGGKVKTDRLVYALSWSDGEGPDVVFEDETAAKDRATELVMKRKRELGCRLLNPDGFRERFTKAQVRKWFDENHTFTLALAFNEFFGPKYDPTESVALTIDLVPFVPRKSPS